MRDEKATRAGELAEQLEKVRADIQTLVAELAAIRAGASGSNARVGGIEHEVAGLRGQAEHLAREVQKLGAPTH